MIQNPLFTDKLCWKEYLFLVLYVFVISLTILMWIKKDYVWAVLMMAMIVYDIHRVYTEYQVYMIMNEKGIEG